MDAQRLATDIVRKLVNAGYTAYFAGGWVRDFLMGHPSDDIDIATNAPPEEILALFPRTILVGLAFGVIIVIADGHQFEVATFRRDINYVNGRKPELIELATPEEDASRRDFTINGMFYDPVEERIHDYVQGIEDLKLRVIRTIGDPYERFFEDRLRMVRAVRFSARFEFSIDSETQEAIRANADSLFPAVAMERIWQEFSKMSKYGRFDAALIDMHRLELLPTIFPALKGVHLHEVRKNVGAFPHYPKGAETILYLMALFPQATAEEAKELCKYLRASNADGNLAEFLVHVRNQIGLDQLELVDKVKWVHLYAHPAAWRCLQTVAASLPEDERKALLDQHQERMAALNSHIKRVVEKKPLVNAALLKSQGILEGKNMGTLLKEAERLVIENDLESAEDVLKVLKNTALWCRG